MLSTIAVATIVFLLISQSNCAEDKNKLLNQFTAKSLPNEDAKSTVGGKDGWQKSVHFRVKRSWPFSSSQSNADIINSYYRSQPDDSWWTSNIQKPFARYVGRSFGDEFPAVRNSIIDHQNQGKTFWEAHQLDTGYHPNNWLKFNWNNDAHEDSNPYNGVNAY